MGLDGWKSKSILFKNKKKWDELFHGEGYKGFNVEEMYQDEIRFLIQSVKEKVNLVSTFENELIAAKTVLVAENSYKKKKSLKI